MTINEIMNETKDIEIQCEYCKTVYDLIEDFPELCCVPEHWYCSKWCYDQDNSEFDKPFEDEEDEY
jgi:hypothetical protein